MKSLLALVAISIFSVSNVTAAANLPIRVEAKSTIVHTAATASVRKKGEDVFKCAVRISKGKVKKIGPRKFDETEEGLMSKLIARCKK